MDSIQQNTLYLTTPGTYVARDHLTLQVEVPVYPPDLPAEQRSRDKAADWRKLSIPIHHLESLCVFGPSTVSPPALDLCWEHGVAVNFLSEFGYLQARMTGVADTSVTLRRTQFRATDRTADFMSGAPRTRSDGAAADLSRRGQTAITADSFHRSLTIETWCATEELAGRRKWATKRL